MNKNEDFWCLITKNFVTDANDRMVFVHSYLQSKETVTYIHTHTHTDFFYLYNLDSFRVYDQSFYQHGCIENRLDKLNSVR